MSSAKRPAGAHSRSVYRRRRLLVGLGLLAVLVVIVLIIVRPGQGGADAKAPVGEVAPKAGATTPTAPAAADGDPCVPANLRVEALTDSASYAAGEKPQLSLSITNTAENSCVVDAGTAELDFTITSGSEVYWRSSDCQKDATHTMVELLPGKTVTTQPITWDRTRSNPSTCSGSRPAVPAGGASYHLTTSVHGVKSASTKQFLLY